MRRFKNERRPIDIALALCRGCYQRAIVLGDARLSGADLRGKASKWSGRYKHSRDAILTRMRRAGVPYTIETRAHGHLVLVIADKFPWAI